MKKTVKEKLEIIDLLLSIACSIITSATAVILVLLEFR